MRIYNTLLPYSSFSTGYGPNYATTSSPSFNVTSVLPSTPSSSSTHSNSVSHTSNLSPSDQSATSLSPIPSIPYFVHPPSSFPFIPFDLCYFLFYYSPSCLLSTPTIIPDLKNICVDIEELSETTFHLYILTVRVASAIHSCPALTTLPVPNLPAARKQVLDKLFPTLPSAMLAAISKRLKHVFCPQTKKPTLADIILGFQNNVKSTTTSHQFQWKSKAEFLRLESSKVL